MALIVSLLIMALDLYFWLIVVSVIVSWLVAFDVLNARNKWVYKFCTLLNKATNPVMLYVRRFIPPIGGIDLSPMVVIFGIFFLQRLLYSLL